MSEKTDVSEQQILSIQQAIDLGIDHHKAGRLPDAESVYNQILQAVPNQPVALHMLGLIAHHDGKFDTAVDLIKKALAINPKYAEAHYNLSVSLKEQGKLDEAVASIQMALTIKPDFAKARINLGPAQLRAGQHQAGLENQRKTRGIIEFENDGRRKFSIRT